MAAVEESRGLLAMEPTATGTQGANHRNESVLF